jgi:uncharacterized protein YndB with AHSA1/START domain
VNRAGVAAEQDPIERQIFIPARPETVFRFFVEPELIARWIGRAQFAAAEEGGLFRLQFTFGEGHTATGIFTEISPPERIAFSFGWEGYDNFPPGRSLVEIQLREQAGGTVLKLKHTGFPDATGPKLTPKNHADRWSHYLSRLAEAVDR